MLVILVAERTVLLGHVKQDVSANTVSMWAYCTFCMTNLQSGCHQNDGDISISLEY